MPQMSPMSWTFIFLILIGFTLLTMSNMYKMAVPSLQTKILKNKENSMSW